MSTWSYVPGGTTLGDRLMALRGIMYEAGRRKEWNELMTFALRVFGSNITVATRTQFAQIDLAAAGDVTTAVPKSFEDPFRYRQQSGYPTTQVGSEVLQDGFVT